jgi:hypothetical protein
MHKKKHHAKQAEIRHAQLPKLPIKNFCKVKTHDQQHGERPEQIEISRIGCKSFHVLDRFSKSICQVTGRNFLDRAGSSLISF